MCSLIIAYFVSGSQILFLEAQHPSYRTRKTVNCQEKELQATRCSKNRYTMRVWGLPVQNDLCIDPFGPIGLCIFGIGTDLIGPVQNGIGFYKELVSEEANFLDSTNHPIDFDSISININAIQ